MAKTDIKSAFRIIPVHSDDHPLLGMKWDNLYYYDRCLPMGCSSSCAIFEAFSTALEWIAINRLGASSVLHILDDFLFIAESSDVTLYHVTVIALLAFYSCVIQSSRI